MYIPGKTIIVFFCLLFNSVIGQPSFNWAGGLNGKGQVNAIVSDMNGSVYLTGSFSATVDFDPGSSTNLVVANGNADLFILKLDINGNFLWVKTIGGNSASASGSAIKIDNAGNICLTGSFANTIDFDPGLGIFNLVSAGSDDVFVEKLDPTGNFIWAKKVGSSLVDGATDLSIDGGGNFYVTGFYYSVADFDPGPAVYNLTSSGQREMFVLKLNSSGSFLWAKSIGGPLDDLATSISLDIYGNVWTTGYFAGTADFDPGPGTYTLSAPGGNYATFVSKLDANGNFALSKVFLPSSGLIEGFDITSDALGNIYSTGYFNGVVDFDPGLGSYNLITTGFNDVYVSKLDNNGVFLWAKNFGGTSIDNGKSIEIDLDNNIIIGGNFQSMPSDFDPGPGAYTLNSNGNFDFFINKLDVNGNFLCVGSTGSTLIDYLNTICIDANNDVISGGFFFDSADFDPGPGTYSLSAGGLNEAFVVKYRSTITTGLITNTLCLGGSITLTVSGADSYTWEPINGLSSGTGSLVIGSPTATTNYTVTGTTGCYKTYSPITVSVLPKPVFSAALSPQNLICVPDSILLQSSSTNTNAVFKWRKATSSTYTTQPFYAKSAGNYYGIVTDAGNGCNDSSLVNVINFQVPPNAKITSHNYINALTPIDTVTCYKPTIILSGASDTVGVTVFWKSVANNSIFPNPANVTGLGNFKLFVKRNDNQCSDSSLVALINQNNALPGITTNTNITQLSCSLYSTNISAAFNPTNCSVYWVSPSTATLGNPGIANSPGKYKFFATNPVNGCTRTDSVNVIKSNVLLLQTSKDTTVCKNSPATIYATTVGTVTGINYMWNSSQTTSTITVTNSVSSQYVVTASGSGCVGKDTINVNIPQDIQDSIITFKNCSNTNAGSIVIYAKGGIPPYKYSLNNGNTFSSTSAFTGLPFGNYNVIIKDSLGCIKQATTIITPLSNLPEPKFLASTKNYLRDTIVLVDISNPKPDSVQWILPGTSQIIGGSMFNPVVVFSDTGSFFVTIRGFYGNCIIDATKPVHFAPYDSLRANSGVASGIKAFNLYPNPNSGHFSVNVEFYKKQSASLVILDVNSNRIFQKTYYDILYFTEVFDLSSVTNGIYVLRVIGEYDSGGKTFIINK